MEVRACRVCGKMFNYITGQAICENCRKKREELFQEVKKYINENRGATMDEIIEGTGVSSKLLQQWIREERLVFDEKSPIKFKCEHCGVLIRTGRFCDECKNKLGGNLDKLTSRRPGGSDSGSGSGSSSGGLGMHYLR